MPFSVVYCAFLLFMTRLWYEVRGQDRGRPEFLVVTGRYVIAMAVSPPIHWWNGSARSRLSSSVKSCLELSRLS